MAQCRACGYPRASGGECPRCGAPLGRRIEASADQPPAPLVDRTRVSAPISPPQRHSVPPQQPAVPLQQPFAGPPQHTVPLTGVASPVRKLGKRRRRAFVMGAAALSVAALAAGVAFAVPYLGGRQPSAVRPEDPRTALAVTGAMSERSIWHDGYRELWQVDPNARIEAADPSSGPSAPAYGGRSTTVVALTSDTGTASGSVLAVAAATGATEWLEYSQETCSGIVKGDLLRCQGGRMGYYPTELMDLAAGDGRLIRSSQELGVAIPDGQEDTFGWSTYVVDGVLLASWTTEGAAETNPEHGNVARINDAGTALTWRTEYAWNGADLNGRVNHGILTDRSFAVDLNSGALVLDAPGQKERSPVQWVAETVIQDGSGTTAPTSMVAPDGEKVTRIGRGGLAITTQALPKHPLRQVGNRIEAFDPATGGDSLTGPSLWSTEVLAASGDEQADGSGSTGALAAYHDGLIALAQPATPDRQSVELALLDEATGAVVWQTSISRPAPGGSLWQVVPAFTADGSLLVQAAAFGAQSEWYPVVGARLTLLDTGTSRTLWTRSGVVAGYNALGRSRVEHAEPGWIAGSPFSSELESYSDLVVDNLDETYSMIAPKPATSVVTAVPSGAPDCPSGMTPVAWTQYAEGAILLCQQDKKYAVVYPGDPKWWANQLNFTGEGYEVVFSNQARLRVTLGGALVYLEQDGSTTTHPATNVWDNASGVVSFTVPADVKTCPTGSWPISLSTFKAGWLLVCGTATGKPTVLSFSDGTTVSEATAVTSQGDGYCATLEAGVVCAYRAPALITVTPQGGGVRQHSVAANYFTGYGQGGAGEGTGSYGVQAPDSTAKDQVRYLTQILQKSMTGRSNLNRAVTQVRTCTNLAEAITAMNSVTANREELLAALDSTPVDLVPDGSALVAKLRTALQLSHDSDLVWARWAQSEQVNGCSEGEANALYRQVTELNRGVSEAKDDFLSDWNTQIAAAHDAPTFSRSQI